MHGERELFMAEPIYPSANNVSGGFSDAVCIDAGRVYDSCMDRDCLENLRVYFNSQGQAIIQNAPTETTVFGTDISFQTHFP